MESIQGSDLKPVDELIQTIDNNVGYFDKEQKSQKLIDSLRRLKLTLKKCSKSVDEIENFAHEYDFDEETPGNGFRSFVEIFDSAVQRALKLGRKLIIAREGTFFRADKYSKLKLHF